MRHGAGVLGGGVGEGGAAEVRDECYYVHVIIRDEDEVVVNEWQRACLGRPELIPCHARISPKGVDFPACTCSMDANNCRGTLS